MMKPSTIVQEHGGVPDVIRLNDNVRPGGQTGGFLGSQWDPDYFVGDPSQDNYHRRSGPAARHHSAAAQ